MQILVVDDHALFREGLTLVLQNLDEHASILQAGTAEEALRQLALAGSVELLLIDIDLPGADGLELIERVRSQGVTSPLAVISASEDPQLVRRTMAAGAKGFIPKATDSATMLAGLRRILDGETWLPRTMRMTLRRSEQRDLVLTHRQQAILEALAEGESNQEIADRLGLTTHTVKFHLSTLFRRLDVRNRTECVARAKELRLLGRRTDHADR